MEVGKLRKSRKYKQYDASKLQANHMPNRHNHGGCHGSNSPSSLSKNSLKKYSSVNKRSLNENRTISVQGSSVEYKSKHKGFDARSHLSNFVGSVVGRRSPRHHSPDNFLKSKVDSTCWKRVPFKMTMSRDPSMGGLSSKFSKFGQRGGPKGRKSKHNCEFHGMRFRGVPDKHKNYLKKGDGTSNSSRIKSVSKGVSNRLLGLN
jgi:hypothetical protein